MNDSINRASQALKKIELSLNIYKKKIIQSKKISLLCYIACSFFAVIFILLTSFYFTIYRNNILFIFSIISLVIAFIFLQVAVINSVLIKYLYKAKLISLSKLVETINKEINKNY